MEEKIKKIEEDLLMEIDDDNKAGIFSLETPRGLNLLNSIYSQLTFLINDNVINFSF